MGTIRFLLPPGLPAEMTREFERACLAGGFDNAPGPTRVQVREHHIDLRRTVDESGFVITPWPIAGVGRLMTSTSTLIEREEPYSLAVELARGKVNQVRNHAAEWRSVGTEIPRELEDKVVALSRGFGRVIALFPSPEADQCAQELLTEAFRLADRLLPAYAKELFQVRHHGHPRLDSALGCQLSVAPASAEIARTFNAVRMALSWREIEPIESQYSWDVADAVVDWAESNGLPVSAGPLIDFSTASVPDWLWIWQGDLSNLANFMCDYVETVISRYRRRIRRWFIATGCNVSGVLGLGEDDILWLTNRLAEAAVQMAPELEIVIGVSEPWGQYMAHDEHTYTPLVFLDTLLRTGLKMAALDVDLAMGVAPKGSYCRDLLEVSRLLESYAVLGTPVQVTLGIPSGSDPDPLADPNLGVGLGEWDGGFTAATQARYGGNIAALALSKPFVTGVYWSHVSDALPHRLPHAGLLGADDRPKPVLDRLRQLRDAHLR